MDDDKWITDLISNVIVGVIKFALWAIRAAVKLIQFATIVIYHTTLDALSRKYPDARPGRLELIAGALAVMPTVAIVALIAVGAALSGSSQSPTSNTRPAASAGPGTVQLLRVIQGQGDISSIAWSPSGTMFADAGSTSSSTSFTSEVRRASDGAVVASHQVPDYWLNTVSWSPDGRYIAGGYDSDVQIWSALTGSSVSEIGYWANLNLSWSPDSQYLLTSGMGEPTVWSAASGSQVSSYSGYPGFQESAFWSPREDLILSDDVIWNGLTGKMIRSYASGNLQGHFFEVSSWSPNGTEIASVEPGGQIVVWDAATGATIWQGQGNLGAVSLSWSPNGQYIAWVSDEQSEAGILNSKTGSPVTTFGNNSLVGQGVGSTSSSISWSPDAKYIATVNNGEIQMWQAPNWSY